MHKKKLPVDEKTVTTPAFRGRVWIDGIEGTFLGYGRIVLLERIGEYGSITKAAKSMEMSYRHAWDLVDSMNRQSEEPFVETSSGGKGGGGARLTESGEQAIELFQIFAVDFQTFLKKEQSKLLRKLLLKQATTKSRQKLTT